MRVALERRDQVFVAQQLALGRCELRTHVQPARLGRPVLDLDRREIQDAVVAFDAGQQQLAGQVRQMPDLKADT